MDFLPLWPIEPNNLAVFGILLLAGALGGFLAHRWPWLPSITGFMLVGLIIGPSGLDLLTTEVLLEARVVVDIALGLILYRLGLSLDLRVIAHAPYLLVTAVLESAATFLVVYLTLAYFGFAPLPAALIAAISISSSPAVLLHVAHEVNASGPVTESAQSLVALNNVIAFLAFSALLPSFHSAADAPWQMIVFQPLYRLVGSILLATVAGHILHYLARKTKNASQYHLALVAGAIMLTLGAAETLNLSTLFAPLVLGIVVKNLEHEDLVSDLDFGEALELFFIVLFVFAGANMHLRELLHYGWVALALVAARSLAKWSGAFIGGVAFRRPLRQAASTGLLLMPMAGLAIGLVQTSERLFPAAAAPITALVLAAVAVFEFMGPPLVGWALRLVDEAEKEVSSDASSIDTPDEIRPADEEAVLPPP
ncbi:MAG: cation:proton antiporter [Burkholderiales bacterium]|nr:cation:proton antiporter [Burkholderiales bacterium]